MLVEVVSTAVGGVSGGVTKATRASRERAAMVDRLHARGVDDPRVLAAMGDCPVGHNGASVLARYRAGRVEHLADVVFVPLVTGEDGSTRG